MDFKDIKELIKIVNESDIDLFELDKNNVRIKICKQIKNNVISVETINEEKSQVKVQDSIQEKASDVVDGNIVEAPIVGTLYLKPSPKQEQFVKVGQKVNKGDVLCIIEAMKVMNEVTSNYSGEVVEILVQDGEMVEYSQPIFRII